jgi:hypothetical protein
MNATLNAHAELVEQQLGVTQRVDRGDVILVIHRVTCRLKAARTPLEFVSTQQRWSEARPCTTCQPSKRQLDDLAAYIEQRREIERAAASDELQTLADACIDDADDNPAGDLSAPDGLSTLTAAQLADDAAERDELEAQELSEQRVAELRTHPAFASDLSEQQRTLIELRESQRKLSEIDAALIQLGVDPHAPVADVVPLTKRGKHNVRRNAKHDQRDVQPRTVEQTGETRECVDCHEQRPVASFPTSTRNGERVRLDYCRKCRTVRQHMHARNN